MCNPRCALIFFKFAIAVPRRERLAALVRRHDAVRPRDPPTHCADGVCRSRTRALALTIPSLVLSVFLSLAPAVFSITLKNKETDSGKINLNVMSLITVQPPLFSLCPSVRPSLRVSLSAGTPRMNGAWVGTPAEPAGRCALLCSRICSQGRRATQPHSGSLNAARPCPAPLDLRRAPQGLCITPPRVSQLDASTR